MTEHFKLNEFIKSSTADKYNINNMPTDLHLLNLNYIAQILEDIRGKYQKPIYITSGYRSKELNKKVGGSPTSYHLLGLAVDVDNGYNKNKELFELLEENINEFPIDELIDEYNYNWVHISFSPKNCNPKRKIRHIE